MSKVQLQGNASGTGIFTIASPNSNTDRTLTLPDNTGTILTSASTITQNNGPAFSAYASASQTPTTATNTKIAADTEFFDTASCYNTSNYRFTPNVAGYYIVRGCLRFAIGSASTSVSNLAMSYIYKNGSEFYRGTELRIWNAAAQQIEICTIMYLNGSTDYIEFYGRLDGSTLLFEYSSTAYTSQFSAALIRT